MITLIVIGAVGCACTAVAFAACVLAGRADDASDAAYLRALTTEGK